MREVKQHEKMPWKKVHCQQFFANRQGSAYFQVGDDIQEEEEEEQEEQQQQTSRIIAATTIAEEGKRRWIQLEKQQDQWKAEIARKKQEIIQKQGGLNEVNPWLERTEWLPYLDGFNRTELFQSMRPPQEDEKIALAVWNAMEGMLQCCHQTVQTYAAHAARMEAIRTEEHQTNYRPLMPYKKDATFAKFMQKRAWKRMIKVIEKENKREESEESEESEDSDDSDDSDKESREESREESEEESEEESGEEEGRADMNGSEMIREHLPIKKPGKLSELEEACLRFCIELLNQRFKNYEYEGALVCALAVLGLSNTGWESPATYPPKLSAMIKMARFMVIQEAVRMNQVEIIKKGKHKETGIIPIIKKLTSKMMVRGSRGPMQWMLDLRTYGMKTHYSITSAGNTDWVGESILYKNIEMSMHGFRKMVHDLVKETRRILTEDLLMLETRNDQTEEESNALPQIPWQELRDNPVDERPGWNFLQDQRTQWPVDGKKWLWGRIGKSEKLRSQFYQARQLRINQKGVDQYMKQVQMFRSKLLVLVHITGGQPARGPEILSIRHENTLRGGQRNVFIENGLIVFVTRYHKGNQVDGTLKVIHRYVPRGVGELVVWFLWLVLPFQTGMEGLTAGREMISSHMWPEEASGEPWTSDKMSKMLKREFILATGHGITISSYREIAIAISRRYLRGNEAFKQDENSNDKNNGKNDDDDDNGDDDIMDLHAGHGSHVADMIYGRLITEQRGVLASKRERFRQLSIAWHRSKGVTVVVVPLIALRQDMKRRCHELNISCVEWSGRQQIDEATIVLVTPESAVSGAFTVFLNRMRALQRGFRKEMAQLGALIRAKTQIIMLTATLPVSQEETLWQRMRFDSERVLKFRARTTRANIAYSVVTIKGNGRGKDKNEEVVRLARVKKQQMVGDGKMIVYCSSVARVRQIAVELECNDYYHHSKSKEEKMKRFQESRGAIIVTTSALGLGVDIPDIRVVIHADRPRNMLDYAQESGRIGRDGKRSEAWIIVGMDEREYGEADFVEGQLVEKFLWGDAEEVDYRRGVLDEYLDGFKRDGCEEEEEQCDVCRGVFDSSSDDSSSGEEIVDEEDEEDGENEEDKEHGLDKNRLDKYRRQSRQQQHDYDMDLNKQRNIIRQLELVRSSLQVWSQRCIVCSGLEEVMDDKHDITSCSRRESQVCKE
ncbi:MAG: hypothetical protein Q9190_007204 [Brigantiaea leucoxantha]